jgi:hypothetical protein
MSEETIERTFAVTQPARLKVSNICGSVDIRPGADSEVKVTAVKHLDSGDADRTRIEIEQASDGGVTVKTHFDHDHGLEWLRGSRPCKVTYSLLVPAAGHVQVRTVSGTASVRGLQGEVEVKSVSGDVELDGLTGKIELEVVSGDASLARIKGELDAEAVSGKVDVRESDCSSIKASTVSGNIKVETPLGNGPYDFRSVSGAVRLTVPGETGCNVRMSTISGRIHTTMPVTALSSNHGHQSAEVQGGGVGISVNTVSGGFSLEHTGEVKPVKQQKTPEERKAVLEKIAAGEISVEDALAELNS